MTEVELVKRLECLERDNRRLKGFGIAALVLAAALGVIYAGSCSSVRKTSGAQFTAERITAREFDVLDNSGKVRVKIAIDCSLGTACDPAISLFDQDGKDRTVVGAGVLNMIDGKSRMTVLSDRLDLERGPDMRVMLTDDTGGGKLSLFGKGASYVFVNSDPPVVEIHDTKGFMTDLGTTDLTIVRTGTTQQTSAASILMFGNGKDHHVIWQAP